jgi:glutamyl-tRNA synthetase
MSLSLIRMTEQRTRLAPSPTGALHLGNARTFLINWAIARQNGWRVILRIDDLDGPRIKPGSDQQAIDTLRWLGLDWDEGPYYQRQDPRPYRDALSRLARLGLIYPCRCTRAQIEAASLSAPHAGEHELRYPSNCRPRCETPVDPARLSEPELSWRIRVPDEPLEFTDLQAGQCRHNVQQEVGDFLVATKSGLPSYQLAVVVDDARQGITQVVRGDDLLSSTPRQLFLYRVLGLAPLPQYTHLPLVVGEDGRRLAKRHGDTRIDHFRQLGVPAERVIALLARWSGIADAHALTARQFAEQFDQCRLPAQRVTYSQADDDFLTEAPGG